MKNYIICLGLGKNQIKLIKILNNKFHIIGIDRILKYNVKKFIHSYYKSSIYDIKGISKIIKIIKKKKIKIHSILYRSSGPSILSAELLEKKFNIKRIDKNLKNSIYSKSYLSNYLKRKKIQFMPSESTKIYSKISKKNFVLKPDAPIYGKKNIFFRKKKIAVLDFNKCLKESHNNKVNFSKYYEGKDISSFYLVNNLKKRIFLLSHIEEINYFKNSKLINFGICSPPLFNDKKFIKNKESIDKSIIKLFKNFHGIFSITSKILIKTEKILPYEVNIGLSGDKFADYIFPYIFNNKSLYKIETDMALFKTKKNTINQSKNFISFIGNKKILSKSFFIKKVNQVKK